MMPSDYQSAIRHHYEKNFHNEGIAHAWAKGSMHAQYQTFFRVLEFPPTAQRKMWTYATCGMSAPLDAPALELHMFAATRQENLVEILTATAYFHHSHSHLGLHHTINFGQPWQAGSHCTHGFISLPYLDGPPLEDLTIGERRVKCYWLVPVTEAEVRYKATHGVEALEDKFENARFNYIDPARQSVV